MAKRETKAAREARVARILAAMDREYGTEYRCYLNHETPWQLLIAVIMSAQCTDARVNIVTADLFRKYDTLEKFAQADLKERSRIFILRLLSYEGKEHYFLLQESGGAVRR